MKTSVNRKTSASMETGADMKTTRTPTTGFMAIALAGGLVLLTGCIDPGQFGVPFGAVSGRGASRSLNGLGVHQRMWESAGAKCLTPQKLSPRLESFDVIVLVGQSFSPPGKDARDWLEAWLAKESGRTVIYFGRDFNAEAYYRARTLDLLPVDQRARGAEAMANVQVREMNDRIRAYPEGTFCRWFYLDTNSARREISSFDGPWASDLAGASGSWPVGVLLQPPAGKWRMNKPSWLTKPATTNPLKPSTPPKVIGESEMLGRSVWRFDELVSTENWNAEFRKAGTTETLLAAEDGQPLIYRVKSRSFENSQILIVTNGAPLLNGSLVEPLHRAIGQKLVEECLPAKRVALLAYGESGLLMAHTPEEDQRAAGLEMLTVWPLSGITMPAALLGIVVCAVLWPILGRPQALAKRSVSDFGLHVEALGRMLHESRDVAYAKNAIAEYFQKVRGEAAPAWLESLDTAESHRAGPPGQPAELRTAEPLLATLVAAPPIQSSENQKPERN